MPPTELPASAAAPKIDTMSPSLRRGLLAAILLVAAILRLYRLDQIPPPMNSDEASRGYDAWSLWETGRDQFGESWPFLVRSFGPGDYPAAASAYIAAPFTGLLGPSPLGIRLAIALSGIATVLIVYLWLYRERNATWALIAAFLVAVNPWHVRMSRWAPEANIAPFFLAIGLYFFTRAGFLREPNRNTPANPLTALAAGLLLGIGAWVYHAPRLVVPLMLIGLFLLVVPFRAWAGWRNSVVRRRFVCLIIGLFIGTIPITYSLWRNPERLLGRVQFTSVFSDKTLRSPHDPNPDDFNWGRRISTAARQYTWYFNPIALGWNAEVDPGVTAPGHSWMTLPEVVLFLAGIVFLLRTCRRDRFHRLLLVWLVLYPIPAAMAVGPAPNPLRAICGLPILPIVAAVGANWLRSLPWGSVLSSALLAGVVIHTSITARFYATELPAMLAHHNNAELFEAFEWAAQSPNEWDAIYVTPRANQPQAVMLVATRFDPHSLHQATRVDIPWSSGYYQTLQIDKWHFMPKRQPEPWELIDLPGLLATHAPGSRVLILCRPPSRGRPECPWGEIVRTFSAGNVVWLEARRIVIGQTSLPPPAPSPG